MVLILSISVFILVTTLFILDMNRDQNINSNVSTYFQPLFAETIVSHNYAVRPELVWQEITKLSDYNFWFPGILRILPVVDTDRFVHQYSFDKFQLAPGSSIKVRPFSLSPLFAGRVISVRANKKLSMELRFNPFHKETIIFDLEQIPEGTSVTCTRFSKGIFSWMSILGFANNKSKILDNLGYLIPEEEALSDDQASATTDAGPQYSREAIIARSVQAGLDGNMDMINAIPDKPTRGMAKAMLVQTKRKGGVMPDHLVKALSEEPAEGQPTEDKVSSNKKTENIDSGLPSFDDQEQLISFVVNKALDGDDEPLNAIGDKVTRGKAKALIVKIKRGSLERPKMPEVKQEPSIPEPSAKEALNVDNGNSESELIERLVAAGLDGNMDEINALDDRVLRGKIKAAIVKAKRAATN